MPLKDHFQGALARSRFTDSFQAVWSVSIMDVLNGSLPRRFIAEVHTVFGRHVETDVTRSGIIDYSDSEWLDETVPFEPWLPPTPSMEMPVEYPDDLRIEVHDREDDARLLGVVQLVSPRNKDRPASRRAFAVKCMAYLQCGVGLVVVDIVTNRQFNLHDEMIRLMGLEEAFLLSDAAYLYTVAYRPVRRQETNQIDVWPHILTIDGTLPVVPLALRGYRAVPLDLEITYNDACTRSRL